MALSGYVRDPQRIKDNLVLMPDKSIVARKPCKIVVPASYQEKDLANIGSDTFVLGVLAIIIDDKYYGVTMTSAMMQIDPVAIQTVKMDGDEYLEFSFDAGSRVFVTNELVKKKTITYYMFDEFISKGNVPWFIEYEDLPHIYDTSEKFAGTGVGGTHAIFEIVCAMLGRERNDRRQYFRHIAKSHKDQIENPPVIVPFRSVIWNATNTTSKVVGSHSSDGMTSALVYPAQRVEKIEELLRR